MSSLSEVKSREEERTNLQRLNTPQIESSLNDSLEDQQILQRVVSRILDLACSEQFICSRKLCLKNQELFENKEQRRIWKKQAFEEVHKILRQYAVQPKADRRVIEGSSVLLTKKCFFQISFKDSLGKKSIQVVFKRNQTDTVGEIALLEQEQKPGETLRRIQEQQYFLLESGIQKMDEFLKRTECFCGEIPPMIYLLKGDRFCYSEDRNIQALPSAYWDNWKEGAVVAEYVFKIYPRFIEYFLSLPLPSQIHVLEICGGDGLLASALFSSSEKQKISSYTLVDFNATSLQAAEIALKRQIEEKRVKLVRADITDEETWKSLPSFDLILGVGALNTQVLSDQKVACSVLDQICKHLAEGAFLLLTGYSYMLIDFADLEERSLRVLNMTDPNEGREFYVAQKRSF
jgi:hypothetical protein